MPNKKNSSNKQEGKKVALKPSNRLYTAFHRFNQNGSTSFEYCAFSLFKIPGDVHLDFCKVFHILNAMPSFNRVWSRLLTSSQSFRYIISSLHMTRDSYLQYCPNLLRDCEKWLEPLLRFLKTCYKQLTEHSISVIGVPPKSASGDMHRDYVEGLHYPFGTPPNERPRAFLLCMDKNCALNVYDSVVSPANEFIAPRGYVFNIGANCYHAGGPNLLDEVSYKIHIYMYGKEHKLPDNEFESVVDVGNSVNTSSTVN